MPLINKNGVIFIAPILIENRSTSLTRLFKFSSLYNIYVSVSRIIENIAINLLL